MSMEKIAGFPAISADVFLVNCEKDKRGSGIPRKLPQVS